MKSVSIVDYLHAMADVSGKLVLCEQMNGGSCLWNYEKHKHDYAEIIYFLRGNMLVNANNRSFHPKASGILFYPPGVEHQEIRTSSQLQEVITLGYISEVPQTFPNAFLLSDSDGIFRSLFHQIYALYREVPSPITEELLAAYRRTLFLQMCRFQSDRSLQNENIAQIVAAYIQEHYYENISLSYLANLVSISPSQLIRTFQREFHTTPGKYLETVRVEAARQLLQNTSMRINVISEQVGYQDTSYFWRVFKNQTGNSPSSYRKRGESFDPPLQ